MEVRLERQDQASRTNHLIIHKIKERVEGQDVWAFVSGLFPGIREGGIWEARRLRGFRQGPVQPGPILITFALSDIDSQYVGFRPAKNALAAGHSP